MIRTTIAMLLLAFGASFGAAATEAANSAERTVHVSPHTSEEPFRSYYAAFFKRLVAGGAANFPKVKGKPVYGSALVLVTVLDTGAVEKVEIVEASSPAIEAHTVALVKKLQPFQPFGAQLRERASRLVIVSHLNYVQ